LPIELAKGLVVSELQKIRVARPRPPRPSLKLPLAEATADAGVNFYDAGAKAQPSSKGEPAKEKSADPSWLRQLRLNQ